ncbi:methyltransferase domain-containing protein [Bermanella sp. R86510]|uniref:methyltransferase domain-containing protein n=1 Tax=unclassified Bermanella TaxID=2627862 RepID=UPI0037CA3B54
MVFSAQRKSQDSVVDKRALAEFKRLRLNAYQQYKTAQTITSYASKQDTLALACRYIEQALAISLDPDGLNLHSRIELDRGNISRATQSIKQALQIEPDNGGYWYSLGHCALNERSFEQAVEYFKKAIALAPNETQADIGLAYALAELGESVEAFQLLRKLVKTRPKDSGLRNKLLSCSTSITADYYDPELEQDLITYLKWDDANTEQLGGLVSSLIINKFTLTKTGSAANFTDICECPLFLQALKSTILKGPLIESLILSIRHELLSYATQNGTIKKSHIALCEAICQYCFNNEYMLPLSDAESNMLNTLRSLINDSLDQPNCTPLDVSGALLLVAMYQSWLSFITVDRFTQYSLDKWPLVLQPLLSRYLEHIERMHNTFERWTELANDNRVKDQYEQFPYPRWQYIEHQPITQYGAALAYVYSHVDISPRLYEDNVKVLVAGCGTGRHAINVAKHFSNVTVDAIDISQSSLAYAFAKSKQYDLTNIRFAQADLVKLGKMPEQYDIIECSGVLHHIEQYKKALENLLLNLRPGGLLKISLYSEAARKNIAQFREAIKDGLSELTEENIKTIRQTILHNQDHDFVNGIITSDDFYSLSGTIDLLFHQYERQFTLLDIKKLCEKYNLNWLGFSNLTTEIKAKFNAFHRQKGKLNCLDHWHEFEQEYPKTFSSMYQFYCQYSPKGTSK